MKVVEIIFGAWLAFNILCAVVWCLFHWESEESE